MYARVDPGAGIACIHDRACDGRAVGIHDPARHDRGVRGNVAAQSKQVPAEHAAADTVVRQCMRAAVEQYRHHARARELIPNGGAVEDTGPRGKDRDPMVPLNAIVVEIDIRVSFAAIVPLDQQQLKAIEQIIAGVEVTNIHPVDAKRPVTGERDVPVGHRGGAGRARVRVGVKHSDERHVEHLPDTQYPPERRWYPAERNIAIVVDAYRRSELVAEPDIEPDRDEIGGLIVIAGKHVGRAARVLNDRVCRLCAGDRFLDSDDRRACHHHHHDQLCDVS
jgi:hypothetical protein